MKKLIMVICLVMVLMLTGCTEENPENLKAEISELKLQRDSLKTEVESLRLDVSSLSENKLYMQKIIDGEDAKFILSLELKQSHFGFNLEEIAKDEMNKVTFDIAVDKQLYDEQEIDSELLREFRSGSLLMNGSFGDWVITVTDKHIEYLNTK